MIFNRLFSNLVLLGVLGLCPLQAALAEVKVLVQVEGLDSQLEQNARLLMSIEQQKDHELLNETRLRRLHKLASEQIQQALQPFGYYKATIKASLEQRNDGVWLARYQVQPGPALHITEFALRLNPAAQQDTAFQRYLQNLPLKQGDILNQKAYESIKSSLLQMAFERGYFEAKLLENRIEVSLEPYHAIVRINFDSGPRYRFGRVQIDQDFLEPELLQRYVNFEAGQPYLFSELISLRQALSDSEYFQSIEVEPGEPDNQTLQVPVEVRITPRKPNRYSIGLGYGTDTGARSSFGWEKPLINRYGHRLRSELKFSELGQSLTGQYLIPVLNPRNDRLIFSASFIDKSTDTSSSRINNVGASLNHGRGEWRETLSLEYQTEQYRVANLVNRSELLIPGINWSRSWGQSSVLGLQGIRLDLDLQGADDGWVSDTTFVQFQTGLKLVHNLSEDTKLIARGRVGTTRTENFDRLPSSLRFFTGGAQTVRGYAYQSLGPRNSNGEVIGGRHLLVSSLELNQRIKGNWGYALFVDAGNAFNNHQDQLQRGAGFGLRWQSPVGPVRLDLASALSRDGQPWRLHINIGPEL